MTNTSKILDFITYFAKDLLNTLAQANMGAFLRFVEL